MATSIKPEILSKIYADYLEQPRRIIARKSFDQADSIDDIISEYTIEAQESTLQAFFRPAFGKEGFVVPQIGHHPDFLHLKEQPGLTEACPIVTLFLDMVGSTRLGIIYTPDEVFHIKNAILRSAIDIATSFDGHIHRIMGDAIMVFFGGKTKTVEESIINAVNAACSIQYFTTKVVIPQLKNGFGAEPFGIRIGIDYAPKDKILWGSYGYTGVNEVTATSFHVDVASKLQHAAGHNQIMIGQSLKEQIDFPTELLMVKTKLRNNETVSIPYVTPNYTGIDSKPINYKQFILDWKNYLQYTPIARYDADYRSTGMSIIPYILVCDQKGSELGFPYEPCSTILPKEKYLRFSVEIPSTHMFPKISYHVENHGAEAESVGENYDNHNTEYDEELEKVRRGTTHTHWEHTQYKGLHYMIIKLFSSGRKTHEARLGIYIA